MARKRAARQGLERGSKRTCTRWRAFPLRPDEAAALGPEPGRPARLGELTHAQDVALALGHRDHAARIEQIEGVARLDALIIGRQAPSCDACRCAARGSPAASSARHSPSASLKWRNSRSVSAASKLKREYSCSAWRKISRIGDLLLAFTAVEIQVEDRVDALHIHRKALEPIGDLARHRRAFETRHLLEIGELRDFHAVAPASPSRAPRRRASGSPNHPRRNECHGCADRCRSPQARRDRDPENRAGWASRSPGTGNNAEAGWGSRHSARPWAGARAAHRRRARIWCRARATSSPDERCRRPSPCRKAAGSHSPRPPRIAEASG